jgi:hypothetical protein
MAGSTGNTLVRRKAAGTAVFLIAALFLLGGGAVAAYAFARASVTADQQSRELFGRESQLIMERVDGHFQRPVALLGESVANADLGVIPLNDREKLGRYLATRLRLMSDLAWFSYSDDKGRFFGARREPGTNRIIVNFSNPETNGGQPEEFLTGEGSNTWTPMPPNSSLKAFDARSREWYQSAANHDGVVVSRPYRFNEGPLGLTAALAYRSKGKLLGVFTADLYLSDISKALEDLASKFDGLVALTGREAQSLIVPASASEERVRPLVDAMQAIDGGFKTQPAGMVRSITTKFEGQLWMVLSELHATAGGIEWVLIVAAPEARFVASGMQIARYAMYVCSVLFVLGLLGGAGWGIRVMQRLRATEHALATVEMGPSALSGAMGREPLSPAHRETTLMGVGNLSAVETPSAARSEVGQLVLELPERLHVEIQDLAGDVLLKPLPKMRSREREFPSLGGVPLLAKLGQGGMGAVYFGYHPRLRKEVAVKVLSYLSQGQTDDSVKRFQREASLAARIVSPHLVQVFDVNEEGGVFYSVIEYVSGISAADCAGFMSEEQTAPTPEAVALDVCIAATKGLCAAHEAGIVHRDIKPDNILIPRQDSDGALLYENAKLLDLGIAREEQEAGLTGTRMALGTVGFMAPEQARDARSVSKAADVFAMGATLYAMLTGRPPFAGNSAFEILMATVSKPHKPVQEIRHDVGPMTAETIDRCLKKNALDRFEDAQRLLVALEQCRRNVDKDINTIRLTRS